MTLLRINRFWHRDNRRDLAAAQHIADALLEIEWRRRVTANIARRAPSTVVEFKAIPDFLRINEKDIHERTNGISRRR